MRITKQSRVQAKRLFRLCLEHGLLNADRARQVVEELAHIKPRGYLAILTYFHRLVELDEYQRSALIESAAPVDAQLESSIRSGLERRYGPGLNFRFTQRPDLLGGVRIRVGSDVYDGTVLARLNAVRRAFDSNGRA